MGAARAPTTARGGALVTLVDASGATGQGEASPLPGPRSPLERLGLSGVKAERAARGFGCIPMARMAPMSSLRVICPLPSGIGRAHV